MNTKDKTREWWTARPEILACWCASLFFVIPMDQYITYAMGLGMGLISGAMIVARYLK